MADKALSYIFFLSLALIALAYYAGLKSDSAAFFSGLNQTIQTATGRNASGQFAGYPTGA